MTGIEFRIGIVQAGYERIDTRNRSAARGVLEARSSVDGMAVGICSQEAKPVRECFVYAHLQRVVVRAPVGFLLRDGRKDIARVFEITRKQRVLVGTSRYARRNGSASCRVNSGILLHCAH